MRTSPRALVVEDDRAWQQLLVEMLVDEKLIVDVVATYMDAIQQMRAVSHRLAVVDLSLRFLDPHNRDGIRVLDALRQHDPACVPILLTGYATVEIAVEALTEHGAFTFLRKETFRRREFLNLVRKALAQPPLPRLSSPSNTGTFRSSGGEIFARRHVRGRVLILEDDAGWQNILAELLSDMGFAPRVCAGFAEALGYLRRERYLLAVVDLALAGTREGEDNRDGYRLLANTKASGIPTLVVSGMGTPGDVEQAYQEQEVFAYIEKRSFSRRTFVAVVEEAVESRTRGEGGQALTPRERQVIQLLSEGLTNKQIGERLVISPNTVKRHVQAIFDKMGVNTRSAAVAKWLASMSPEHEEK